MYCQRLVVVKGHTYLGVQLGNPEEWGRQTKYESAKHTDIFNSN
jgi:hypothetical protein